jgi:hypothetical protein
MIQAKIPLGRVVAPQYSGEKAARAFGEFTMISISLIPVP